MHDDDDFSGPLKDLNFKVPAEFHQAFKIQAALEGIEMRRLLVKIYRQYRKAYSKRKRR